ncbi:hypothetical protein FJT64_020388 [Amphibalanus amphitrite]|uniref:Uncharacterized protein n=1 Tax=Amphibalanus amphitrite TaxID=1232801 RepID=A0A6A4WNG7_AMPAM|nr:hypothetical protein FJT64_020388 [Amphibalanus amphitrite]
MTDIETFYEDGMFEHSSPAEGPGPLATSTLGETVHGYRSAISAQHARRRMPLLRDMSYEDLPASDTYRLLPDVCDATGGGGAGAAGGGRRRRPARPRRRPAAGPTRSGYG